VYAREITNEGAARYTPSLVSLDENKRRKAFIKANHLDHWYILNLGHTNNRTRLFFYLTREWQCKEAEGDRGKEIW
jgi:hypothetical protein